MQAGTWAQVHLLGTAALERFTGYVGQSRSRCATHTWNVTRVADVDHGGVLAEQRTPDREVLDAMLRLPDTGFAVHDTAGPIAQLLTERAEHERILATKPPERLRLVLAAKRELDHARKQRDEAAWRFDNARSKFGDMGFLSQLRSRGRHDKAALVQRIDRFEGDLQSADGKVMRCEHNLERAQSDFAEEIAWGVRHGWRAERLDAIDAELAEMSGEPELSGQGRSGPTRPAALLDRRDQRWEQRLAEIAAPRLPDTGHGIDIGF